MKTSPLPLLILLVGLLAGASHALTTGNRSFTCPIDGNQWKQEVEMSGTSFGRRLDLRPIGPTGSPWTAPQCPKCRFVLFEDQTDKATVGKLKPYILSEAYQTASKDQPSYFCIALIQTFLKTKPQVIGHAHLKASWQTEANPKECRRHLESALAQFTDALTTLKPGEKDFQTTAFLCCELERRTGRFDEARKRAEALLKTDSFKDDHPRGLLERELEFIGKKDLAPHAMTDELEKFLTGEK